MISSVIGKIYIVKISGGSHEKYIEAEITGLSPGTVIDFEALRAFLKRRAPGRSPLTSQRKEDDEPVPVSGGGFCDEKKHFVTDGTPLLIRIENTDIRKKDYATAANIPRPGHADYTGAIRYPGENMSGGGPFSGRMTAAYCIAGGIALQLLEKYEIDVSSRILSIGKERDPGKWENIIRGAKERGDSVGGIVETVITGVPAGLGGAMFDGAEGALSYAFFGIPAVKEVAFGETKLYGSENNDAFCIRNGRVETETNNCGGILGGVTDGMPVTARITFKPAPSVAARQSSVDLRKMKETDIEITGRHDPCVVPRALPVCDAAAAMCILDLILQKEKRTAKKPQSLHEIRKELDILNIRIAEAFNERMALCRIIADIKEKNSLPLRDEKRENEILEKMGKISDPEISGYSEELFRKIFELSRALQKKRNE